MPVISLSQMTPYNKINKFKYPANVLRPHCAILSGFAFIYHIQKLKFHYFLSRKTKEISQHEE